MRQSSIEKGVTVAVTGDGSIDVSTDVRAALDAGRPVVALESSIVAQGFPQPQNREVGLGMLAAVRDGGAVPAMTAVIDGRIKLGLDETALDRLAFEDSIKCSAQDLGMAMASGVTGATTVAATLRIAATAGVRVFATGGIGGVHPGTGAPDISADLPELGRCPVAVICSGAKSVLDLPATLERLETEGVPVIGVGCDELPAFHTRSSGLALKYRMDDMGELARAATAHWSLPGAGAVLVCNPPPADAALDREELDGLVAEALAEAGRDGIRGDAVTPYVLAALNRLSNGRTLKVNHALAVGNAALGARLAVAMAAAD